MVFLARSVSSVIFIRSNGHANVLWMGGGWWIIAFGGSNYGGFWGGLISHHHIGTKDNTKSALSIRDYISQKVGVKSCGCWYFVCCGCVYVNIHMYIKLSSSLHSPRINMQKRAPSALHDDPKLFWHSDCVCMVWYFVSYVEFFWHGHDEDDDDDDVKKPCWLWLCELRITNTRQSTTTTRSSRSIERNRIMCCICGWRAVITSVCVCVYLTRCAPLRNIVLYRSGNIARLTRIHIVCVCVCGHASI